MLDHADMLIYWYAAMLICFISRSPIMRPYTTGEGRKTQRDRSATMMIILEDLKAEDHLDHIIVFFILVASSRNLLITWFNSAEVDLPNANIQMKVNVQNQIRVEYI